MIPLHCNLAYVVCFRELTFCSTMIVAILRTIALVHVSFPDVTYTGAYALTYSFLEPAIGISVACAPLFRPVFRRAFPKEDIELTSRPSDFRRIREPDFDFNVPHFVDANIRLGRPTRHGRQEVYITTQVLENGNWSQASASRTSIVT
jgi:hypothetical protein